MRMEPTPGIWEVRDGDDGSYQIYAKEGYIQIGTVGGETPVQAEANARLMAAAKELHQACEQALTGLRDPEGQGAVAIEMLQSVLRQVHDTVPPRL